MSPARGDPGVRRATILEAALRLFGQYGYRRTSMDDIASEAEIAKGTVYLSFRSKEEVFRALSEELAARMLKAARAASRKPGSLEDRLVAISEAWFGAYYETIHRAPHAAELVDSKHRLASDLVSAASAEQRRLVIEVVEEHARNGDLRLDDFQLGVEAAADLLIAALRGLELGAMEPTIYHLRLEVLVRVVVAGWRVGTSRIST